MSRAVVAVLVFLTILTIFAQPGLCPCWLMMDIQTHHPHPNGHPEAVHDHDYLNSLFNAGLAAIATLTLISAQILIALLTATQVWRLIAHDLTFAHGWTPSLEPPPPRLSASSDSFTVNSHL